MRYLNTASVFWLLSLVGATTRCGLSSEDTSQNSDFAAAAAGSVGDALQTNEVNASSASALSTGDSGALSNGGQTVCGDTAFSCENGIFTRAFPAAGCTRGNSIESVTVFGSILLTKSPLDCTLPLTSSQSLARTLRGHYIQNHGGKKVIAYTGAETIDDITLSDSDLVDFEGHVRSGGSVLTKTDSGYSLVINGIHRRGYRRDGSQGFWHTVYTSAPIVISETSTDYTVESGTIVVANNAKGSKMTSTLSGIKYSKGGSCCYPVSGTVTQSLGEGSGLTLKTVFSADSCGDAVMNDVTTRLPPCGASEDDPDNR